MAKKLIKATFEQNFYKTTKHFTTLRNAIEYVNNNAGYDIKINSLYAEKTWPKENKGVKFEKIEIDESV